MLDARWAVGLSDELRRRVVSETATRHVPAGGYVCRKGDRAEHWIGVLDGLVKVSSVSHDGKPVSFIGVPAGGWFGEGSLLKRECRRYDAIALRHSTVALVPLRTFDLLIETWVPFNRFLLDMLNERLGQFIAMVEHGRIMAPEARLAHEIVALMNPLLYPGNRPSMPISQEELALLVGLSRQRVNGALQRFQSAGIVRLGYGCITVLDIDRLRHWAE